MRIIRSGNSAIIFQKVDSLFLSKTFDNIKANKKQKNWANPMNIWFREPKLVQSGVTISLI